jgi:hypothetical protein
VIGCAGGCGKTVHPDDVAASGWTLLQITGRYRCGECDRNLAFASTATGAPPRDAADILPPHSRGALKELPQRPPLREGVKP